MIMIMYAQSQSFPQKDLKFIKKLSDVLGDVCLISQPNQYIDIDNYNNTGFTS